eukprot:Plantae.Rhodophyta-Hildenbrandia_rubra.ctg5236.p1 GENE.Plantae.Rhodophyta-Hildenbrandia_rubra.ctg5236~~Plantae.Rhodophyta-Hildenbrandia_rubra.ctg5236.p1  ORF type:complete len:1138 (+),score=144.50 Plantae.Rhodophyta-Hildenbrandia_rubra.ctg5236:574-3987(+)
MYFRCRRQSFEVASVGFAKKSQGKEYTAQVHHDLASLLSSDSSLRFYGGLRFDGDYTNFSSEWFSFSGYTFILPMIEVQRCNNGVEYFSINVMNDKRSQELAISTLERVELPPQYPVPLYLPQPVSIENIDTFEEWKINMHKVLNDMADGRYKKIVLARRKRFLFDSGAHLQPLDVLDMLSRDSRRSPDRRRDCSDSLKEAHSYTNGSTAACNGYHDRRSLEEEDQIRNESENTRGKKYLFYLQLSEDQAFVSATPECLFHEKKHKIETEALAGTVEYGPHDVEELLSDKNMEEHQYVVDFLKTALTECHAVVDTDGPHVLRLPRLMHLKTNVTGLIDTKRFSSTNNINSCPLDTLLRKTHPTPAVCGYPEAVTKSVLREIEGFDRGFYAGPVGWFSSNESEFCVAIRSALMNGNSLTAYGGCGIVQASDALDEWEETELKMSAFVDFFHHTENFRLSKADTRSTLSLQRAPLYYDSRHLERLPNINSLWGFCAIEELLRHGIDQFFVAPGSRSTPLVIGIQSSRRANSVVVHDERAAAFMALGYAKSTGKPAVVVTTSGTAVANLLPATVEASNSHIPLILLTADRPPELRDVGANQSINQVNIFGNYCRWFKDLPCPSAKIPLRNLLSDVDYAVYMAGSIEKSSTGVLPGPVHLNCMFREKLAPDKNPWNLEYIGDLCNWATSSRPLTRECSVSCRSLPSLGGYDIHAIANLVHKSNRGIVLVGNGAGASLEARREILRLAEVLCWPILADVASGIRFGPRSDLLLAHADLLLSSPRVWSKFEPDCIIQFNGRFTSKRFLQLLGRSKSKGSSHILITENGSRENEHFSVTHRVVLSIPVFASQLAEVVATEDNNRKSDSKKYYLSNGVVRNAIPENGYDEHNNLEVKKTARSSSLFVNLVALSSTVTQVLDTLIQEAMLERIEECLLAVCLTKYLDSNEPLFVSNSMPIRDLDMFGMVRKSQPLQVIANRGASGIDGILSSALGVCIGCEKKTTVYIGDMAMIHDLNALHMLRDFKGHRITTIVLNNGGGGIFSMLPIAKHSQYHRLMNSPHSLKFQDVARGFGIEYEGVETLAQFCDALRRQGSKSRIIEIHLSANHAENADSRRTFIEEVLRLSKPSIDSLLDKLSESTKKAQ